MSTVRLIVIPPFTGVMVTMKLVAGILFTVLSYVHVKVTVSWLQSITKFVTGLGGPKKDQRKWTDK